MPWWCVLSANGEVLHRHPIGLDTIVAGISWHRHDPAAPSFSSWIPRLAHPALTVVNSAIDWAGDRWTNMRGGPPPDPVSFTEFTRGTPRLNACVMNSATHGIQEEPWRIKARRISDSIRQGENTVRFLHPNDVVTLCITDDPAMTTRHPVRVRGAMPLRDSTVAIEIVFHTGQPDDALRVEGRYGAASVHAAIEARGGKNCRVNGSAFADVDSRHQSRRFEFEALDWPLDIELRVAGQ
ncbi:MAG: hypothetical protein HY898_07820 [Deltaproteobacteria bacterium]|nr:hypothetical protein [Deltaproteobacteria bacterium]